MGEVVGVAKLTDKQRKKLIADRAGGSTIRQLAAKYSVSTTTVQRTLRADPRTAQMVTEKKAQNTADILVYMDNKRDVVCAIIGDYLEALRDPEKIAKATTVQLSTTMGILIDKFAPRGSENTDGLMSELIRGVQHDLQPEAKGTDEDLAGGEAPAD